MFQMIAILFQKQLGLGHLAPGTGIIEERGREVLTERDDQGWQVLHQDVAGGNSISCSSKVPTSMHGRLLAEKHR
jgi:hypothetical protein